MVFYDVIKSIMVMQAVGLIMQGSCHCGCVHDKLEAKKGISSQFYDFKKTIGKTAPTKSKHVRADSKSSKSAELNMPKSVHRAKRSSEDAIDDGSKRNQAASSSRSQKEFASAPRNVNKSIGAKRTNLSSQTPDKTRISNQDKNKKEYLEKLFKPIRIKIFMQEEYISFQMTSEFFKRLNESIHRAVKKIQNILSVIPVKGRLRFNRTPESICSSFWSEPYATRLKPRRCAIPDDSYSGETCMNDFKLPDAHLRGYPIYRNNTTTPTSWLYNDGVGIADADMVLYVHARNTILCKQNGLLAYATYCQVDQYHRPIAGLINYCPRYLKDDLYNKDVMYTTSLHEIFHILGFSKDLFDKFQTCEISIKSQVNNRTLIKWVCEKRKNTISFVDGVKNIVSPAVRRETKRHFGCDTVEGCPLENHIVSPVTTSSHWEGRLMQGSLMAPTISQPHLTVIDRVTLSAFEDMGWYQVNYNQSEELVWGNQAGCDFLSNDACTNESSEYFCHDKSSTGCHYLHLDKGTCKTDKYLDGCRVFKPAVGMECWKPENGKKASRSNGEIYSADSRCFQSDLHQRNMTISESGRATIQGRCYEHRCNEDKTLEVRVQGSEWKACPDKEYIVFEGYEGGVVCPDASVICRNTSQDDTEDLSESEQDLGMIVCGNFTITIPGLTVGLQSVASSPDSNDATGEFKAKLGEMIVESTNVCKNCVTDVQHKEEDKVNFILKMQLPSTNISASASANAASGTGESNSSNNSNKISVEGGCVDAVRDLLESSSEKKLRLTFAGNEYSPDKIDFESPIEGVIRLKETHLRGVESGTSGAGLYVAAAVGSVCGSVLIMVGVVIYLKNAINVAVSPIPATPIRADVPYHFNSCSINVAPSENGSAGQLPNVDIP